MAKRAAYITKPGAYDGIAHERYLGNCTPAPALNATGAWQIESECPAYFYDRASFNPDPIIEERRIFDIGRASHLIVLEPKLFDKRVAVIDAPDYRAYDAQRARDLRRSSGQVPLLTHELAMVTAMRNALRKHPIAKLAFRGGKAERSYFWQDRETGIWCKARPDYSMPPRDYAIDYKTSTSARPDHISRQIARLGFHVRAAWYLDAIEAIEGARPERFCFIVQSVEPPHLVSVAWLENQSLLWGRLLARHARETFARCLAAKEWPGYRPAASPLTDSAFTIGLPAWSLRELQIKFERGEFNPPAPANDREVA